jgi:hypothetical protein
LLGEQAAMEKLRLLSWLKAEAIVKNDPQLLVPLSDCFP